MTTMIALFRGLNVGGSHRAPMAELRGLLEDVGCVDPRTWIQSGNAVFRTWTDPRELQNRIEETFVERFGFASPTMLCTLAEWETAIDGNPFPEAAADQKTLHLGIFRENPDPLYGDRLSEIPSGKDELQVVGRFLYLHVPAGLAPSRLAQAIMSSRSGPALTLRNWRTVLKLREMARDAEPDDSVPPRG